MKVSNADLGSDLKPRSVTIKVGGVYYVNLGLVPRSRVINKVEQCIVIGHYSSSHIYTVIPCISEKDKSNLNNTIYEPVSIVNGVQSFACINQIVAVDEEAIDEYIGVLKDIKLTYIVSRVGKYLMGNNRIKEIFGHSDSLRNNIENLTNENEKLKNELIKLKESRSVKEISVISNVDENNGGEKSCNDNRRWKCTVVDTIDFGDGCKLVNGTYYIPEYLKINTNYLSYYMERMNNDDLSALFKAIYNITVVNFSRLTGISADSIRWVKSYISKKRGIDLFNGCRGTYASQFKINSIKWEDPKVIEGLTTSK